MGRRRWGTEWLAMGAALAWLVASAPVAEAQARGRSPSARSSSSSSSSASRSSSRSSSSNSYTTSGSTRRVGSSSRSSSRSSRGGGEGRGGSDSGGGYSGSANSDGGSVRQRPHGQPLWHRRTFHRVALDDPMYLQGNYDCTWVDHGYCTYPEDVYVGQGLVGFSFSVGMFGGIFDGTYSRFDGIFSGGDAVPVGLFGNLGFDLRLMFVYDRMRIGGIMQVGGSIFRRPAAFEQAAHEHGSEVRDGWVGGGWGTVAYAPQLSSLVQLWIGGRVGVVGSQLNVYSRERRYTRLGHLGFSAGPEIGIELSSGVLGARLTVFGDLVQLGNVTSTLAFTAEFPRAPGEAL